MNFESLIENIRYIVEAHLNEFHTQEEMVALANDFLGQDQQGKLTFVVKIKSDKRFKLLSIFDEIKLVDIFKEVLS